MLGGENKYNIYMYACMYIYVHACVRTNVYNNKRNFNILCVKEYGRGGHEQREGGWPAAEYACTYV